MINVLLVEEDSLSRKELRKMISWESNGYEIVAEADNGIQALNLIRSRRIDLVIMELPLYGMSSKELVSYVKQQCSHPIHFAAISEFEDFKLVQEALRLGVIEYLVKPVKKEELLSLLKVMGRVYKKEHEIELRKQAYEQIKYRRALIHVLVGKYSLEEMKQVEDKLLTGKQPVFRFVSFEIRKSPEDPIQLQNECMNYLKKILKKVANHVVPSVSSGKMIFGAGLIINSEVLRKLHMQENELIHYLIMALEQHLGCQIQVYMGISVSSLGQLVESFRSVNVVRLFSVNTNSRDKIISYEELSKDPIEPIQRNPFGKAIIKELTEAIMNEDIGTIESTIDRIDNQIAATDMTLGKMCELFISTISSYKEIIEHVESTDRQNEVLRWMGTQFLDNFVQYGNCERFKKNVLEYSRYFHERKREEKKTILDQIDDYVVTHYNMGLSLKTLGEMFYINSVYLGQLYKKKYGISFKEYLTNLRITKSVELLEDTELRVYEIAEQVGFTSADYFINKFVKAMGKTPQQYRMEVQIEEDTSKLEI